MSLTPHKDGSPPRWWLGNTGCTGGRVGRCCSMIPASLLSWSLLLQWPVLYRLREICLSSALGSCSFLPAVTTCGDPCVFVCHMRGLCDEGKFGVHPRTEKKERMVRSPAAVGSWCGLLGWGEATAIPGAWGAH